MKTFDVEERVQQAIDLFNNGHNCAQSVFMAYADLFDLTPEMASKMSVSFGGGMGRMREVCGTVSAMSMLVGFKYPVPDPSDQQARTRNYA
ncbi:MAG: C-GCAxxG-C-C family protein, partial [Parabacteroides sp.]